jgi:hypothetical protein
MAWGRPCGYAVAVPGKKRPKSIIRFDLPCRVDAREILALAHGVEKPLFRVSGPAPLVDLFKGMLKVLGVPPRRIVPQ